MTTNHDTLDPVLDDTTNYQVFVLTSRRSHAMCLCGWAGHERLTTSSARIDAWIHAAQYGHMPTSPLGMSCRAMSSSAANGGDGNQPVLE